MSAFFEHLRENLGIREEKQGEEDSAPKEEEAQEPPAPAQKRKRSPSVSRRKTSLKPSAKKPAPAPAVPKASSPFASWEQQKGELGVDVYETDSEFVIQGPIAGVEPNDIHVSTEDDMVVVVGNRENPDPAEKLYRIRECYWGGFSRRVLLPDNVEASRPIVSMNNGILTIRFSKKTEQETP